MRLDLLTVELIARVISIKQPSEIECLRLWPTGVELFYAGHRLGKIGLMVIPNPPDRVHRFRSAVPPAATRLRRSRTARSRRRWTQCGSS
jgi:hypothetical protein